MSEFMVGDLKVCIEQDSGPVSPLENDNAGKLLCWHPDYNFGDENIRRSDAAERLDELDSDPDVAVMLPVFLYDHGGLRMSVSPFSCPWDSGQVGVIYATKTEVEEEWSGDVSRARAYLEARVSEMDQYLSGDVWGYVIEDESGEHLDSCWGFYGHDYCESEARAVAESILKRLQSERAEVVAQMVNARWL